MSKHTAEQKWPVEFEREAHRLAREDERGKMLTKCQQEVINEFGFDVEATSCESCKVSAAEILIHAATRAMEKYAKQCIPESSARLIAAAPTMLKALKDVDKWLMAGFEDSDAASESLHPSFRKAFAKTRAAIKLAEAGE